MELLSQPVGVYMRHLAGVKLEDRIQSHEPWWDLQGVRLSQKEERSMGCTLGPFSLLSKPKSWGLWAFQLSWMEDLRLGEGKKCAEAWGRAGWTFLLVSVSFFPHPFSAYVSENEIFIFKQYSFIWIFESCWAMWDLSSWCSCSLVEAHGLQSTCVSVVAVHGLSRPSACGILVCQPGTGKSPPLQGGFLPTGSPGNLFLSPRTCS